MIHLKSVLNFGKNSKYRLLRLRFIQLFSLFSFYLKINPKYLFKILLYVRYINSDLRIGQVVDKNILNHSKLYGLKNDFSFKELHSGTFREDHFLELIQSLKLIENVNSSYNLSLSNYNEIEEEVILDIGANIGTHTMELAKIFPKRKIMAFEPNPLLFPLLQLNTLIFKNIFTYSFAIAESTGKLIYLDLFDPKIKNTNTGTAGTNDKLGVNPCVTLKLDDILFSRVKLIKLDIQGGELLALQGLSATINTFKPIIFLEVEEFYLRKNGVSSEILLRYLFSFNYEVYRFETAYPTDHIAVPKDFDVSRIRTRYELKRIPSDFRNLIFENKWFYSSFR